MPYMLKSSIEQQVTTGTAIDGPVNSHTFSLENDDIYTALYKPIS